MMNRYAVVMGIAGDIQPPTYVEAERFGEEGHYTVFVVGDAGVRWLRTDHILDISLLHEEPVAIG